MCYCSAASVKLMRFHGGNWHKIQLKGCPFLLCYSSFMPALISEELVCHGEENPTRSVYRLVLSLCPIYKNIQWDSSEKGVFILISSLTDARVKAVVHLSADFGRAASGGPWHDKDVVTFNWLWYPVFAAKQALPMRIALPGKARSTKSRDQVCLQLFIVLLSRKLEITEVSYVKSDEKALETYFKNMKKLFRNAFSPPGTAVLVETEVVLVHRSIAILSSAEHFVL